MKDHDKIKLAEIILDFLKDSTEAKDVPVYVGALSKRFGLNGFKVADIGTPVFEYNDKHVLYLESLDGKHSVMIPFYKGDLSFTKKDVLPQHAPINE